MQTRTLARFFLDLKTVDKSVHVLRDMDPDENVGAFHEQVKKVGTDFARFATVLNELQVALTNNEFSELLGTMRMTSPELGEYIYNSMVQTGAIPASVPTPSANKTE